MDFSIQNSLHKNYSYNEKPYALTCIYYSNKIYVPYLIIIIVNNFFQIYIIYLIYLMYFNSVIYYCGEGWNLPSSEMIISVSFFLTLWNCFLNNEDKYYLSNKNKNTKLINDGVYYTLKGIYDLNFCNY